MCFARTSVCSDNGIMLYRFLQHLNLIRSRFDTGCTITKSEGGQRGLTIAERVILFSKIFYSLSRLNRFHIVRNVG